jgi:hypothetical protein
MSFVELDVEDVLLDNGWTILDWLGQGCNYDAYKIIHESRGTAAVIVAHNNNDMRALQVIKDKQEAGELSLDHMVEVLDIYTCFDDTEIGLLEILDETLDDRIRRTMKEVHTLLVADESRRDELTQRMTQFWLKLMIDIVAMNLHIFEAGWIHDDQGMINMGYIGDRLVYIDLESLTNQPNLEPDGDRWFDTMSDMGVGPTYLAGSFEDAFEIYNQRYDPATRRRDIPCGVPEHL